MGLCIHNSVPTTSGWKTVGELLPGDLVFDSHGMSTTVIHVSEPYIESHPLRITMSIRDYGLYPGDCAASGETDLTCNPDQRLNVSVRNVYGCHTAGRIHALHSQAYRLLMVGPGGREWNIDVMDEESDVQVRDVVTENGDILVHGTPYLTWTGGQVFHSRAVSVPADDTD